LLLALLVFVYFPLLSNISMQVENLWDFLVPLLRKALSAVNVETLEDWGTCMATAVVRAFTFLPLILACFSNVVGA